MSDATAQSGDPVHRILGQAVWAFVALGLAQSLVAGLSHKVVLGADGGHNLLEFVILGISRLGNKQERANPPKGFWNCRIAPRTAEITCYGTIAAAVLFLYLGWGSEERGASWLALVLVTLSVALNLFYAVQLHEHRDHGANAHASWAHLAGDSAASLFAVVAYLVIALGGPLACDPFAALAGCVVIVVVHLRPIKRGRLDAKHHRLPEHTHEPDHAH